MKLEGLFGHQIKVKAIDGRELPELRNNTGIKKVHICHGYVYAARGKKFPLVQPKMSNWIVLEFVKRTLFHTHMKEAYFEASVNPFQS